jgi:hypothetical protein
VSQDHETDAERHRRMAASTEKHHPTHEHAHSHASGGGSADAHEHAEETYFVRHRSKWPAIIMIVLVTIFFVGAIFMVPMFNQH